MFPYAMNMTEDESDQISKPTNAWIVPCDSTVIVLQMFQVNVSPQPGKASFEKLIPAYLILTFYQGLQSFWILLIVV